MPPARRRLALPPPLLCSAAAAPTAAAHFLLERAPQAAPAAQLQHLHVPRDKLELPVKQLKDEPACASKEPLGEGGRIKARCVPPFRVPRGCDAWRAPV